MQTREFSVAVRRRAGFALIDLHGDVDSAAEAALEDGYADATRSGARRVILNLEHASFINSTGIALIVALLARARAGGVELSACGLSDHYREIFEITRLTDFMAIIDCEEGADDGAGGSRHG